MTLIRCTQKLLKELGNPPLQRKTLYSFLIPKVKKENLKIIIDEFLFNLNMNLQAEGFPLEVINRVMAE